MTEININNFKQKFPDIKKNIEAAKFIGIDLEFSALNPFTNYTPSLFDNPKERYIKLRKNVENTIPVQIGLTAFKFDADRNSFEGSAYTFYVKPGLFSHINRYFLFETSAIEFLALHNFDFNKFFYTGIPYISKIQEEGLLRKLKNDDVYETNMNFCSNMQPILDKVLKEANEWYEEAKIGEILPLNDLTNRYVRDIEFKFFFHKYIRRNFGDVMVHLNEEQLLTLKKVATQEIAQMNGYNDLNEEILDSLLGFTKVYKLLVSLKKPIIAHNALMDILILITNFEGNLPSRYEDFKKLTMELFPIVFDTKHIYYEMRSKIPENKQPSNSDLKTLFHYFRDGVGRHIAMLSPGIEVEGDKVAIGKFHDAGWDSFCAGYIFIRLAYLEIHGKHPLGKVFMPTEYLRGMFQYKNCLNVIRASINYVNLNGADPACKRPPLYVIEACGSRKLDYMELTTALSAFGSIEVKPISWRNNKALVAVDNYSSAKAMIREFKKSERFKVHQYSSMRHSPVVRAAIWGSVTLSGITLLLLMRIVTNR
ncbi:pre-piRNA 3'-exonuclease trimmer-like [Coccinella septempunctata]|uniref:pre-piRNA 3'-exonuclease trimmer-like n=1 Tax=Coccinella septempunctata TaxID=41139 RepID=UPI001D0916C1|nr:pre-piRNA 3'-exonuclease trimmer-like [Coccinella septempunctata]